MAGLRQQRREPHHLHHLQHRVPQGLPEDPTLLTLLPTCTAARLSPSLPRGPAWGPGSRGQAGRRAAWAMSSPAGPAVLAWPLPRTIRAPWSSGGAALESEAPRVDPRAQGQLTGASAHSQTLSLWHQRRSCLLRPFSGALGLCGCGASIQAWRPGFYRPCRHGRWGGVDSHSHPGPTPEKPELWPRPQAVSGLGDPRTPQVWMDPREAEAQTPHPFSHLAWQEPLSYPQQWS